MEVGGKRIQAWQVKVLLFAIIPALKLSVSGLFWKCRFGSFLEVCLCENRKDAQNSNGSEPSCLKETCTRPDLFLLQGHLTLPTSM